MVEAGREDRKIGLVILERVRLKRELDRSAVGRRSALDKNLLYAEYGWSQVL